MSKKIEKTLELNITHELLSLADSFWWYVQPISLHRYWRPHWRFPIISGPKSFATGLHINLEGKAGGGYDVCINSPSTFQGGNPRLLFMQFKAGVEQQYNADPKSCFFGSNSQPNVHVEFDINSNAKRNQHKLLQNLAAGAGNDDAVVYVFPRIVDEQQLTDNLGKLLLKTSFVSIKEINAKATKAAVVIEDGHPHKFRCCYFDYDKNEVNRFFFFFGKLDQPGSYIGEIFAIRLYRALKEFQKAQLKDFPTYRNSLMDAMIRHLINIANHFNISRATFYSELNNYPGVLERMGYYEGDNSLLKSEDLPESNSNDSLFSGIVKTLSIYIVWIQEERYFDDRMNVPKPPSNFTIELPKDGIRFELDNMELDESDLNEITYQIL